MPKGERSKNQRTVTISVPRHLVDEIDALAASENRTRSNWIVNELQKIVKQHEDKITFLPARAAESEGQYNTSKKGKRP